MSEAAKHAVPKFPADDGFHRDLKRGVDAYFASTGKSRGADAAMVVKTITMLTWFAASYVLLVFFAVNAWQVVVLCASLVCATAGVGFSVQHDANHGAYSSRPIVNHLLGLTLDMLGASSFLWRVKHNTAHHTYTNVNGADDDMDIGLLARLAPSQTLHRAHRFQHVYLWVLYGFVLLKWHFAYDFTNLARARVASTSFKRPRGIELVEFIAGKVVFCTLAFVFPLLTHPLWMVAICYVAVTFGTGVILAVVFQLAHCMEQATFEELGPATTMMTQGWARHQVASTVDFGRDNKLLTWYVGGLNLQVEHHLFPRICHIHYPALSKVVQRVCLTYGVRYNDEPTLLGAIMAHGRWLRRMGTPAIA